MYDTKLKTMLDSSHSFLTWRKKLKENILLRKFAGQHSAKEFEQLLFILNRTIKYGESDSVLLIGFRGSGKTSVCKVLFVYFIYLTSYLIIIHFGLQA